MENMGIFSILFFTHLLFTDKERFFYNQELLEWVVTSFILVILMFDSVVITYIEIRC